VVRLTGPRVRIDHLGQDAMTRQHDWEAAVAAAVPDRLSAARDEVDDTALDAALRVVIDTVGVIIAGAATPHVRRLHCSYTATSSDGRDSGSATVFGSGGRRAGPATCAFLNGTAGSALELDEGMRPAGHPAMQIVPAALAVAEVRHISGPDLLTAIVCGYEAAAVLFRRYLLRYPAHPHGHIGAVGGAVAVALLTGQDPMAVARAASMSPVMSSWQACLEGATTRDTWMGEAARRAVEASLLVDAGLTTTGSVFADFLDLLCDFQPAPEGGRETWAIGTSFRKTHSACTSTHTAIDAALELGTLDGRDIARVQVATTQNSMKLAGLPHGNDLSTRFSLPYAVAATLILGEAGPAAMSYRHDVFELARRVHVQFDESLDALWPRMNPARVTVEMLTGSIRGATVLNPKGWQDDPVPLVALSQKFRLLTSSAGSLGLFENLRGLTRADDCAPLLRLCG
jgi:2-methylcitrate dehydratase PrpD